jgi:hypothetical protein
MRSPRGWGLGTILGAGRDAVHARAEAATIGQQRRGEVSERSSKGSAVVGFTLGVVIALLVVAVVILWYRGPGRIDTSRPAVVHHIQQLQRLETVVFGMDKIVSGGWESRYLPTFLAGEQLLLIVYGEVTAGVDLGQLKESDVTVSGKAVEIRLPGAEIFATRVDNDRTRVYSRRTGLFSSVDPNLESEVRREAEKQIRQAALDGGVLRVAAANAQTTMTMFLRGLGFEGVQVR